MKIIRLFLVALFLGLSVPAGAAPVRQPSSLALGFMLGSPTGVGLKYWLGGSDAIDFGLGVGPGFRLHGDYLWGIAQLLRNTSDAQLDFYVGAGGLVGVSRGWCSWYDHRDHRHRFCGDGAAFIGARVPVGLDLRLRKAPLSLGLELAPGIVVSPHDADALVDVFFFARVVL